MVSLQSNSIDNFSYYEDFSSQHSEHHRSQGANSSRHHAYKRKGLDQFLRYLQDELKASAVYVLDTLDQISREEAERYIEQIQADSGVELKPLFSSDDKTPRSFSEFLVSRGVFASGRELAKQCVLIDKPRKELQGNLIPVKAGSSRPHQWRDILEQVRLSKGDSVGVSLPQVLQMQSYYN